ARHQRHHLVGRARVLGLHLATGLRLEGLDPQRLRVALPGDHVQLALTSSDRCGRLHVRGRRLCSPGAAATAPPATAVAARSATACAVPPVSMLDVPTNPATNGVSGSSYTSAGEPTCSIRPAFMTASRSLMVSASSWSCVT